MSATSRVVVPFRSKGDPWRDLVHEWAIDRWHRLLPDAEIMSVDSGRDPFCHASSINEGTQRSDADLLIVADADTAVNPDVLTAALEVAEQGGWALAERYCAFTKQQSMTALTEGPLIEYPDPEWLGVQRSFAGFLAIRRRTFVELGGYDERISGWGPDDVAIAAKLDTLLAPVTWVSGTVFHLWHLRSLDDTYGVEGYHAKRDLANAYVSARGDRAAMREVMV